MATISKLPSGKYQAKIRRKGCRTLSKTFIDRRSALAWARKTESEVERSVYLPTLTELQHRTMKVRVAHESGAKMMHAIFLGRAESILIDGKASLATVEVDLLTDQTLPRVSCRDPPAAF